jgi:hypothetical protein
LLEEFSPCIVFDDGGLFGDENEQFKQKFSAGQILINCVT